MPTDRRRPVNNPTDAIMYAGSRRKQDDGKLGMDVAGES